MKPLLYTYIEIEIKTHYTSFYIINFLLMGNMENILQIDGILIAYVSNRNEIRIS